ncbi:MAG: hypothetical protein CND86_05285 [Bacteroidetes bacterium MED-G21]|nr:MAG: hypothetical protein CND86_05285 [Bacteroidetes bacterium MED-G21]
MKKLLLIKFALCLSFEILAQQGFKQSQDLVVKKNGVELLNPWAGGANVPQFSPIDLNADNVLDLMIFDKNGDQINCFINHGTEGLIDYHYAPEYNLRFPKLEDWVLLRDYNCDNKMDIFTSYNGGIRVYKNTSIDEELNFQLIGTILTDRGSGPTNLYVSSVDIPHIGDIDYDGDLDILTFTIIGSHVEWHKNNSVEFFGTCDSVNFELEDECWGDFSENFSDNSVTLYDCEKSKNSANSIETRHSGSTLTALDLNNDSYFELLLGDITFDNIVMLENSASSENALMINQDTAFPNYSESVNLSRFPAAYYFDFDNDSKKDLIVAPNGNNVSHNFENIWFYKNQSNDESVNLNLIARNALLDQMIEVGSGAHPVFFDYNNDDLIDIIVANYGYYTESGNYNSQLALYENIGSHSNPEFEWVTDDYSDLGTLNFENNIIPTFGDLDSDGDEDMIVGDSNGKIHLLKNIFYNDASNFFIDEIEYFDIDIGSFASPFLIDLDRDGDLDLIIGSRQGQIFYYNNEGSPSEPNFVLANEQFGNINLTDSIYGTAYTTPTIIDGESGYELFVGTEKGPMYHYTNIDDNLEGSFEEISDTIILYSKGIRSAPAVYDLNNDGWNDMLLGIYTGGVHLLWGGNTDISIPETASNQIKIYPNPSEGIIQLDYNESLSYIEVYNIEGKLSFKGPAKKTIDLSHLESGFYFVKIRTKTNESLHTKICIY